MYCNFCNKHRKSKKKLKFHIHFQKTCLSIVYSKFGDEYEKIFKGEESIEILKSLGLISNIEEYKNKYNHA